MKKIVLIFSVSFLVLSCNGQSNNLQERNSQYKNYKKEFDASLLEHFLKHFEGLDFSYYPSKFYKR